MCPGCLHWTLAFLRFLRDSNTRSWVHIARIMSLGKPQALVRKSSWLLENVTSSKGSLARCFFRGGSVADLGIPSNSDWIPAMSKRSVSDTGGSATAGAGWFTAGIGRYTCAVCVGAGCWTSGGCWGAGWSAVGSGSLLASKSGWVSKKPDRLPLVIMPVARSAIQSIRGGCSHHFSSEPTLFLSGFFVFVF